MLERSEKTQRLADHYTILIGLYRELERLSERIFEAFEGDMRIPALQEALGAKRTVAERIREESQAIVTLKEELTLSETERNVLRQAEKALTELVKQVVEYEDKSRVLFEKQGIKISRR